MKVSEYNAIRRLGEGCGEPPFAAAGRLDVFGPAEVNGRGEVFGKEGGRPIVPSNASSGSLSEFFLRFGKHFGLGKQVY